MADFDINDYKSSDYNRPEEDYVFRLGEGSTKDLLMYMTRIRCYLKCWILEIIS